MTKNVHVIRDDKNVTPRGTCSLQELKSKTKYPSTSNPTVKYGGSHLDSLKPLSFPLASNKWRHYRPSSRRASYDVHVTMDTGIQLYLTSTTTGDPRSPYKEREELLFHMAR